MLAYVTLFAAILKKYFLQGQPPLYLSLSALCILKIYYFKARSIEQPGHIFKSLHFRSVQEWHAKLFRPKLSTKVTLNHHHPRPTTTHHPPPPTDTKNFLKGSRLSRRLRFDMFAFLSLINCPPFIPNPLPHPHT